LLPSNFFFKVSEQRSELLGFAPEQHQIGSRISGHVS
jgi:hypothetical protein